MPGNMNQLMRPDPNKASGGKHSSVSLAVIAGAETSCSPHNTAADGDSQTCAHAQVLSPEAAVHTGLEQAFTGKSRHLRSHSDQVDIFHPAKMGS